MVLVEESGQRRLAPAICEVVHILWEVRDMPNATHRLHAVLPPYLLDRLARYGNARLRAFASDTLALDRHLLAQRISQSSLSITSAQAQGTAPGQPWRLVHSADQGNQLPGRLVRGEGQPESGDVAVDEAYAWLGATYALFWEAFGRHSIDDAGLPLIGTVHYGQGYENAFWNGEQMVFGDGDGEVFQRFTRAVDIVAHELTHGVIDHQGGLWYHGQSGALNESLCDVFGSLVKQHHLRQTAEEADWLIGEGLFGPSVAGRALRSLAAPGSAYDDPLLGKDPQPGHMRDYVNTPQDNGGVHFNSGIPNLAFHRVALALGDHAWERAGRIWYDALHAPRRRVDCDFVTFAGLTLEAAVARFGEGGLEREAVWRAWREVGVLS